MDSKKIIVTGGAGFIGSNLIRHLLNTTPHQILNVDSLTYAGNLESLADIDSDPRYQFIRTDIVDPIAVKSLFDFRPDAIMHLAAESHVDRSIAGPAQFIQTNVVGTLNLLSSATEFLNASPPDRNTEFRFLHVSTDEVYGSLSMDDAPFCESNPYDPHSPYAASKASADHLVRAWHTTYDLPILITNCSNNYGPYQFPEKLIPVVILAAIHGKPIPVYGTGDNVRDWLHVDDHIAALCRVLERGLPCQTYNIGGHNERTNLEIVRMICKILDEEIPVESNHEFVQTANQRIARYEELISLVTDRPGHDFRYAIDTAKIQDQLGWKPVVEFEQGLQKTVRWYLQNRGWTDRILASDHQQPM